MIEGTNLGGGGVGFVDGLEMKFAIFEFCIVEMVSSRVRTEHEKRCRIQHLSECFYGSNSFKDPFTLQPS